jgi:hypothetical protein
MTDFNSGPGSATYDRPPTAVNPIDEMDAARDLVHYLKEYAREKPEVVALWCLGVGFVLGWKLKPW